MVRKISQKNRKVMGKDGDPHTYTQPTDTDVLNEMQRANEQEEVQRNPVVAGTAPTLNDPSVLAAPAIFASLPPMNFHTTPQEEENMDDGLSSRNAQTTHYLRELQQPAVLFGEDENKRCVRLETILSNGIENDAMPLSIAYCEKSNNNEFRHQEVLKGKRKASESIDLVASYNPSEEKHILGGIGEDAHTNRHDVASRDNVAASNLQYHRLIEPDPDHEMKKNHFDALCEEEKIIIFFKQLFMDWEMELHKRPESEKRTEKGRSNLATLERYIHDLDPLFNWCKTKTLTPKMKDTILLIISCCLRKDYPAALHHYVKLALPYATRPIGANFLKVQGTQASNDTMQRCLRAIKCLVTLCERHYPASPN
ncbi:hypothetical protein KP509_13G030900 [Ceratopteris richardii]|uniref:Pre-mRNA-splicing factor 18 n=1 Tax=Ceratopteris richardii TaxID=49495 RepID=A0A8T2TGI2_CERRI|nr:hypothetical protein KP509_13G030900 [Ceratopteris richardii]